MKTIIATGKYVVTFNSAFGDIEVGDVYSNTIDYADDDIEDLIAEVVADNNSELQFTYSDAHSYVIGIFKNVNDDNEDDELSAVALLVERKSMG